MACGTNKRQVRKHIKHLLKLSQKPGQPMGTMDRFRDPRHPIRTRCHDPTHLSDFRLPPRETFRSWTRCCKILVVPAMGTLWRNIHLTMEQLVLHRMPSMKPSSDLPWTVCLMNLVRPTLTLSMRFPMGINLLIRSRILVGRSPSQCEKLLPRK